MGKKDGKSYYKVFATEDKRVFLAVPTRKPHPKSLFSWEKIDDDGVWRWMLEGHDDIDGFNGDAKPVIHFTIANNINVKRALRQQVETKFVELSPQLASMKEQLDRIDRKLDAHDEGTPLTHGHDPVGLAKKIALLQVRIRLKPLTGSVPQARHQAMNSVTSTRRLPDSQL